MNHSNTFVVVRPQLFPVIAGAAWRSMPSEVMDCHVAALLAMTGTKERLAMTRTKKRLATTGSQERLAMTNFCKKFD